ncbi:MAG: hypothetical protein R3321_10045, partial [Nitrososphaeraceae archaeon]|nr:hypothetical protein [Nitrososphaeraceae archaeon]
HRLCTEANYVDSLDREIVDCDGHNVALHETIGNSEDAKKIRLIASIKADIIPFLKNRRERRIINLMLKGYTQSDVAVLMGLSRQRIDQLFKVIKERIQNRYGKK